MLGAGAARLVSGVEQGQAGEIAAGSPQPPDVESLDDAAMEFGAD